MLVRRRAFLASALSAAPALTQAAPGEGRGRQGFYRIDRVADKWVVRDPKGRAVFLRGMNHYGDGTHMPLNLRERYGTVEAWKGSLVNRHREWGFNYLGPSIGPSETTAEIKPPVRTDSGGRGWQVDIRRTPEWPAEEFAALGYPFTAFLEYPRQYMAGKGLPDVFSQEFRDAVDLRCREFCTPLRDNRDLVGYHFTHNPPWHSTNPSFDQWIADNTLPGSPGLDRWILLMKQIYGSVERWRRTYAVPIRSFDEIKGMTAPLRGYVSKKNEQRDKIAFMQRMCEEWYRVYSSAVRRYDPNHLVLGDRNTSHLSPLPEYAIQIMGRFVDAISINVMGGADIFYEIMQQTTLNWDGPIHLADTGAGVYDPERWTKAGFMTRDLEEFEALYRSLMTAGLDHPQLIGFGWCGYYETPTSRSGVVDSRNDEPIQERAAIMSKWNRWMEGRYGALVSDLERA